MPTVGRMQMLKDPQGAAFYIIQPEPRDNPPDREPEVGEASWLELMTTDAPAAMKFYQELFGWQPSEAMDMGEMGTYQMFNRGDRMIGGMMNKPKEMAQAPPHWAIYFRVPDINAAAERVKANGGTDPQRPDGSPGRRPDPQRDGSAGRVVLAARQEEGLSSTTTANPLMR